MKIRDSVVKVVIGLLVMFSSICANAYRATGTSTEPNVWTRNYSGVLAAAKNTGYPILIVIVNSATCGHCHVLNQLTLNSATFAKMERELTFYKLMMDAPNGGEFSTVTSRYYKYFDSAMYPIIGVLRNDGSMYGSFGNRTTDSRDVSSDIRKLIERLAKEQGADVWSASGVTPIEEVPIKLTVQDWAARLKGKINGLAFDSNQEMIASFALNLTSRGKVMCRFISSSRRTTIKGMLSLDGEIPQIKGETFLLKYDGASKTWSGNWGDYAAYASSLSSAAKGSVYTSSATNLTSSGFVSVTFKNNNGKVVGMVGGKKKVSAKGVAVVIPSAIVVEELGKWATGSDVSFVPALKTGKLSGGVAISANGTMKVSFDAYGRTWTGVGAIWPKKVDYSADTGNKVLRIADLEIPIKIMGGTKMLVVGNNEMSVRLFTKAGNGTFKGRVKLPEGMCRFEGALLQEGKSVYGIGVSFGAGVYKVEIGDAYTPKSQ